MAKMVKKKKKNYRLRKSVRRTLGALFMISAIIVAAIPFPDAAATNGEVMPIEDGDTSDVLTYDVVAPTYDAKGALTDTRGDFNGEINSSINLKGPANDDEYDPTTNPTGAIRTAYNMRKSKQEDMWIYQLQFQYYLNGNDAILYRYNNEYVEEEVELAETVNSGSYIEISLDDYNSFFANDEKSYTLNYSNYDKDAPKKEQQIFEKYFPTNYASFLSKLSKYNDPNNSEITSESQVTETVVVKDDIDSNMKGEYYCQYGILYDDNNDYSSKLTESFYNNGFTLKAVEKITGSSRETAYIAWSSERNKNDAGYRVDINGFIYMTASDDVESYTLKGIADEAFKNVRNVEMSIILPETVSYIGDEAFYNSFVKSIEIPNVREIGNRAFMDSNLTHITWPYTMIVGTEAFRNTSLTSVTIPSAMKEIGLGAFAENEQLTDITFNQCSNLEVLDYAFYDCFSLGDLDLTNSGIIKLGKAAFAVRRPDTNGCTRFMFPNGLDSAEVIGDFALAGRKVLKEVTMPQQFGYDGPDKLASHVFQNCENLSFVKFQEDSRFAEFDSDIFSTINNPEFYVTGPASTVVNGSTASYPRTSTWACTMGKGLAVPYKFNDNGTEYYEIGSGNYLLSLNIKSKDTASVGNVSFVPGVSPDRVNGETLKIEDKVGNYNIIKLEDGCITDDVKDCLGKLIIGNNVTEIGASVFENSPILSEVQLGNGVTSIGANAFKLCPKLETMLIGSGVTSIGSGAFEDCKELTYIKFSEPTGDASSFPVSNIGERAFCTNSNSLIIEGLIDEGYGPFEWAMEGPNYSNSAAGIRPLYKSPDPYELGKNSINGINISPSIYVIYDDVTGLATAIHYPHYNDLKNINASKAPDTIDLCTAYENGNIELTPAELAVIRSALNIEFYPGIESIDVSNYIKAVDNQANVLAYMKGDVVPEISEYVSEYEKYGLFGGNFGGPDGEYEPDDEDDANYETEARGNDFVESVTMHTVKNLPNADDTGLPAEEKILTGTFYSCEKLNKVVLGAGMEDVGNAPFLGCYALNDIDCTGNDSFTCENMILYENKDDGTNKLVQVLGNRGKEQDNTISTSVDPLLANVSEIGQGAIMKCPYLFSVDLTGAEKIREIPDDAMRGSSRSYLDVILPANVREIGHRAFGDMDTTVVTIYGREVSLASDAFENTTTPIVWAYEDTAAYNTADRMSGVEVRPLGQTYRVRFLDWGGQLLGPIQYVEKGGKADLPEEEPTREGYTFTGWDKSHRDITEDTDIYATYEIDKESPYWDTHFPDAGTGSGSGSGSGNGSGTGSGSGGSSGDSDDYDENGNKLYTLTVKNGTGGGKFPAGKKVAITADAAPEGSGFANWSSDNNDLIFNDSTKPQTSITMPNKDVTVTANFTGYYNLDVVYGSGSGLYPAGASVTISAVDAPQGRSFASWVVNTSDLKVDNVRSKTTKVTMPAKNAKVTATYMDNGTISGNSSGNSKNNTSIIITKPGISNTNTASAYVSGSSDNFIVKISESLEAADEVQKALQKKYPDMTRIKYFAMDISLYDAKGVNKITDTTGLKVNITMPIPDALKEYAGNNRVGAVVNGELETLNPKFTTINGVPSITFTATHFSPYTIYVDTGNLTVSNTLDSTPKTGDGIHPKWFVSIALACISIILFTKRDRRYAVKAYR